MRLISNDQEHVFAHQNILFPPHDTHHRYENYGPCNDVCLNHNTISTVEVWH